MGSATDDGVKLATGNGWAAPFEDVLGPASNRYFTAGYKRVEYEVAVGSVRLGEEGMLSIAGNGRVTYPLDWSLDPMGTPRTAHLSSIDAVVLFVSSVEQALQEVPWLFTPESVMIDQLSLRAGSSPVTDLDSIPITVTVDAIQRQEARATAVIGGFRLEALLAIDALVVKHPSGTKPYWDAYRATTVASHLSEVDLRGRAIVTTHSISFPDVVSISGIDSRRWPSLTHIDNIVLFGEVAQLIVQVVEGVPRGSIDNLWMRRMQFIPNSQSADEVFQVKAEILRHDVVKRGARSLHSIEIKARSQHGVDAHAMFGFAGDPAA